jgi:hypothetical protein
MAKIRMNEVSGIALLLFVISIVIGLAVSQTMHHPGPAIFGALVGLYFLFAIKVVRQWEKVAVLRLGRYVGLRPRSVPHYSDRRDTKPLCGSARARRQRVRRIHAHA